jgi:hypothetical protein
MPNITLPAKASKDVVLIDGICYKLVGPKPGTNPSHQMSDIDGQFDTCEQCAEAEKSDLSSSSSSEPAPQNTCNNCDPAIPDSFEVTLAGLPAPLNGCNGTHTVEWETGCFWRWWGPEAEGSRSTIVVQDVSGTGYWEVFAGKEDCVEDCNVRWYKSPNPFTGVTPCDPSGLVTEYIYVSCSDTASPCCDGMCAGGGNTATCSVS